MAEVALTTYTQEIGGEDVEKLRRILERDGFVKRYHIDKDKRRTNVRITSNGEDLLEKIFPDYFSTIASLMSDVTDEEKCVISRFLSKLDIGILNSKLKVTRTAV